MVQVLNIRVNNNFSKNRYNLVIEEKNNMFHDREAVNRQLLAGMVDCHSCLDVTFAARKVTPSFKG